MKQITGLIVLMLSTAAWGQIQNPSVVYVTPDPSGQSCVGVPPLQVYQSGNKLYICGSGNTLVSVGGSGTFNALTGDATSTASGGATTVVGLNGVLLSSLATGILKNTTGTGVPSIAVAGDFPTLNQNTNGSAATAANLSGGSTVTGTPALSTAAIQSNPALFTGGSGTTTFPYLMLQPSGATAETGWSTNGTWLGINTASGFNGNFLDFHVNNAAASFAVSATGSITGSSASFSTFVVLNSAAATALRLGSAAQINYSSTTAATGTADLTLCRQAAGVLEIGASTGCAASGTLQAAAVSIQGARKGTFVCTGGGTITIANAAEAATSDVIISMNTAGGTITVPPAMKTVTAATGFTVLCGATDTSTYNYTILN